MENKITLRKTIGYLKNILVHKFWVFYYACKLGIFWRGITHDLSKFSVIEFWENVRYYTGTKSPVILCKKDKGYSKAWQHHKGRNSHHYEYWVDYLDKGGKPIQMPWKDVLELIADYLGAARTYNTGETFSLEKELGWWENKKRENIKMHPKTQEVITDILGYFVQEKKVKKIPKNIKEYYLYS